MPWITPDGPIPSGTVTKTLKIPDGPMWRGIVTGALYETTLVDNFQEIGDLTAMEVSDRLRQMWEEFLMGFNVVGAILMWPTNSAPPNWLICDGSAIDRATYAELFALIGTTYGVGNGSTTFNLPDLRAKFPVGRDANNARFDTLAETGGQESANHTHILANGSTIPNRAISGTSSSAWQDVSSSAQLAFSSGAGGTTLYGVSKLMDTQNIVTLPPYLTLNFIICAIPS